MLFTAALLRKVLNAIVTTEFAAHLHLKNCKKICGLHVWPLPTHVHDLPVCSLVAFWEFFESPVYISWAQTPAICGDNSHFSCKRHNHDQHPDMPALCLCTLARAALALSTVQ